MPIEVRTHDDVTVLVLAGEFTLSRSFSPRSPGWPQRPPENLAGELAAQLSHGASRLVLDMRGVTFLDSASLGQLIAARKRALDRGGDLRIIPGSRVRELLALTQLDRVFEVFEDELSAVRSFGASPPSK